MAWLRTVITSNIYLPSSMAPEGTPPYHHLFLPSITISIVNCSAFLNTIGPKQSQLLTRNSSTSLAMLVVRLPVSSAAGRRLMSHTSVRYGMGERDGGTTLERVHRVQSWTIVSVFSHPSPHISRSSMSLSCPGLSLGTTRGIPTEVSIQISMARKSHRKFLTL